MTRRIVCFSSLIAKYSTLVLFCRSNGTSNQGTIFESADGFYQTKFKNVNFSLYDILYFDLSIVTAILILTIVILTYARHSTAKVLELHVCSERKDGSCLTS